jgi:DHA2 family multidrug resistance protein-like MFS transporter
MNQPTGETRATRREWFGLLVLAFPCFLLSMDFTVLHLAVPALTADLKPTSTQLLWIVDIYGFLIAGSLITMGTLGDRIGRRKLLLIGGGMFGIASTLAAFSSTATMLIVTRGILGVAGATLMPSTLALIRNMFHDPEQRRVAIAIWINAFVVGGAVGPILGGFMLEHFWWGSVFLLNVPVMGLLLLLGPLLLPEFRDPNPGRLDIPSAALSLTAMLAVIYGMKRFAQDGYGMLPATTIVVGVLIAYLFVSRQAKLEHPLIDLALFKVRAFSSAVGTQMVATITLGGIYFLVAQYLQLVLGLSPLRAGLALIPATIAGILGTIAAPILVRTYRAHSVIAGGMLVTGIGMLILSRMTASTGLVLLVSAYVVMSLGINVSMSLTTDSIMTVAPPERAGAASAISETSAELGLALGIAILGSIATASYRGLMIGYAPTTIPAALTERARSTLGGAVATAKELGGETGRELMAASRSAFAESFEIVTLFCAAMVLVTAFVVWRTGGRKPKPASQPV